VQELRKSNVKLALMVHTPYASYHDGRERLTAVQARREQRGYT